MLSPIKTEKQYGEALERVYNLLQKDRLSGSSEDNELVILSILIKDYEEVHHKLPKPNPLEAIKFRMEQMGLTEKELSSLLGYRSRKSEIFSGKRKLSLRMIRKIHERLKIPADVLIQEY